MSQKNDFRKYYDKELLGSWDLPDRDVVVTIATAGGGEVTGVGGRKSKKPVISFVGKEKKMLVNATNGKAISGMYGVFVEDWVGKRVTLYKTTTQMGGETMECIRIRPQVPTAKATTANDGDEPTDVPA